MPSEEGDATNSWMARWKAIAFDSGKGKRSIGQPVSTMRC